MPITGEIPPGLRPELGAEPSLKEFLAGIVGGIAEGIRQNKVASVFGLIGLIVVIPLTFGSRYDERPRYRQVILPELVRLEERFLGALERSRTGPTDTWRLYHFIDAHRRADDIQDYLRSRRAVSTPGIRAHSDLILYYELVDEHMAIIRTEMSLAPELDFLERWDEVEQEIHPLRDRWVAWLEG